MKSASSYLFLLLMTWLSFDFVAAQFGMPRKDDGAEAAHVETDGNVHIPANAVSEKLVGELKAAHSGLDDETAVNIATIIEHAKSDPETSLLIRRLKEGGGNENMEALRQDLTPNQVIESLAGALSEMNAVEILFQDPDRAFKEMDKDGLVPPERKSFYKKNPQELADDVRRKLYFTFVSAAVAGGFL